MYWKICIKFKGEKYYEYTYRNTELAARADARAFNNSRFKGLGHVESVKLIIQ